MNLPLAAVKRVQSREEEIANSISHGFGLVAALAATPLLLRHAAHHGDGDFIVGTSIFAATMVLLYLASTLYHALPDAPIALATLSDQTVRAKVANGG